MISSKDLQFALDSTDSVVVMTDKNGIIVYANKAFEKLYGYTLDEAIGKRTSILKSGYHDNDFYQDMWEVINSGNTWEGIFRNKTRNGTLIWEQAKISPIKNNEGDHTGFIAVKENITYKRNLEDQIQKEQFLLNELFSNAPIGIIISEPIYDKNKNSIIDVLIIKANPIASTIFSRLGLVGLRYSNLYPSFHKLIIKSGSFLKDKESFDFYLSETDRHLSFRTFPIEEKRFCSLFYDITEYKNTIRELIENRNKLDAIVNTNIVGIGVVNKNNEFVFVNSRFAELLGYSEDELLHLTNYDITESESVDITSKMISQLFNGEILNCSIEKKYIKKDKSVFWGSLYLSPIKNENGEIIEAAGLVADIDEKKKIEMQILKNEQMLKELNSTKDKLFSIIAHDIKNPFGVVLGFANLLSDRLSELSGNEIREYIDQILIAGENTYKLLEDLLTWGRSQLGKLNSKKEYISPYTIVSEVFSYYHQLIRNKKLIIKNGFSPQLCVYADYDMLKFIIRNLIHNAIKFTPENGIIECFEENNENSNFKTIVVKDSGIGISTEKQKELFNNESFLTTLGTNNEKGTGLGLSLVKEMIDKNNGTITIESGLGKGAIFRIELPAVSLDSNF
ncbi:MAG: PAS domain S-box protein [Marinilabiliaceae bacterium]|nr:PAS domain S-box protein [Marinilabiliaceae bacterium]